MRDSQTDRLIRCFRSGIEQAASSLNRVLRQQICIGIAEIGAFRHHELPVLLDESRRERLAIVCMPFSGAIDGHVCLLMPARSAAILVGCLTDESPADGMDASARDTLTEIGNIMLNDIMTCIAGMLDSALDYDMPEFTITSPAGLLRRGHADTLLLARARFSVDALQLDGYLLLCPGIDSFDRPMHDVGMEQKKA